MQVNVHGNSATATKLATARTITLSGAVSGNINFDGSGNVTMVTKQANIAILTGTVVAAGSNEKNLEINYPSGFNNTNSAVLSCGLGRESNNYSYGQKKQNTSATASGLAINNVNLNPNKIKLNIKFDFETNSNITLYYKIILMKTN